MRKPNHVAYFAVLIAINMMWAFQFSGAKIAVGRLGPITVTFIPMALATLLVLPALLFERRPQASIFRSPGAARDMLLLGCFGVTPAQLCVTWGVKYSPASNAAVLTLTIPVLTALMATLFLRERMTLLRWASFAIALAGVVTASDINWRSVDILHRSYLLGNALLLGSCLGSAFYNSFSKRVLEQFSPVDVLLYTFTICDSILVVLMLLFERRSLAAVGTLGSSVWLSLLAIAVFGLAVSMLLYFWVIQRIDVTQASLSIYLLPVFGVMFSTITLHEHITGQLLVGGALVLVSTFLVTTYEARSNAKVVSTL